MKTKLIYFLFFFFPVLVITAQETGINQQHLQEVITATDKVIGKASLEPDFANNFLLGTFEN